MVGIAAEQQRATAEIQAALTVAKHSRRDEVDAVDRIKNACQRFGLAEKAEYVYNRGGTDITGPTIDLLTVIANYWGNIQFGFRELSQQNGESTVEAFAWDLESNAKRCVQFTVAHKRITDKGRKVTVLNDPRDIYELVANYAQRRVRACLEAIVPPDVVEEAVMQCRATLHERAEVTPESIAKLIAAFGKLGVSKEQLEEKIGRRMDAMQPAQLVNMRRIYKSIADGISVAADWFAVAEEAEQAKPQTAKDMLRKKAAATPEATAEPQQDDAGERPQTTEEVDAELIDELNAALSAAYELAAPRLVTKAEEEFRTKAGNDATRTAVSGLCDATKARIKASPSAKA